MIMVINKIAVWRRCMSSATETTQPLVFTQDAAAKVYELIQEEGNPELKLRVFITGGGCSGFQYGFSFDEAVHADDTVIVKNLAEEDEAGATAVQLLIDPMSLQYLMGAEIDYRDDISGAHFVIRNNPNAKTTCGCGSSFSA